MQQVLPLLIVFADPLVMEAFSAEPFEREQMEGWIKRNLEHQERYGYGLFTVLLRHSGLVIGDCGIEHMELTGRPVAELGYDLRSDHWGRGLATEAASAVRDYAFQTLQLPSIGSLIRNDNHRSQRVAEKVGMRLVDPDVYGDGQYRLFGVDRNDERLPSGSASTLFPASGGPEANRTAGQSSNGGISKSQPRYAEPIATNGAFRPFVARCSNWAP
jgi:RimJ/RimL family protein N-acetyltransferase